MDLNVGSMREIVGGAPKIISKTHVKISEESKAYVHQLVE